MRRSVLWGQYFKGLFFNKKLAFLILSGLLVNLAGVLALKFFFPFQQETVILHYNAFLGIDQVEFNFSTNRLKIFLPSIGGALIWLINFILGLSLYFTSKENKINQGSSPERFKTSCLGAYLLWLAGDIVQIFVLVYVLAIIFINQ